MIAPLRGTASFELLRREGLRARHGALSLVTRHDPTLTVPQVAFSVPRSVGPAVTRNRLRRRLREILRSQSSAQQMPIGQHLLICRPEAAHLSFRELSDGVEHLFVSCRAKLSVTTGNHGA
ncbi:MAG: ribonuclease P protein component [Acidimicrobiia bacterium]